MSNDITSKFKSKVFRKKADLDRKLKNKVRAQTMKAKLEDEQYYLRELRSKRERARYELSQRLSPNSPNSKPFRKVILHLREEARKTKQEMKSKYLTKIRHLRKKYREKKKQVRKHQKTKLLLKIWKPGRKYQRSVERNILKYILRDTKCLLLVILSLVRVRGASLNSTQSMLSPQTWAREGWPLSKSVLIASTGWRGRKRLREKTLLKKRRKQMMSMKQ